MQGLAALAAIGAVATTYVILSAPDYVEYNPLVSDLAAQAVLLAMASFVGLNLWYLGLGVVDLGWVSNGIVVYHVGVMGTATLNNLVLFAIDESLLDMLGGSVAYQSKSALFVVVAVLFVLRRHGLPPLREIPAAVVFIAVGALVG